MLLLAIVFWLAALPGQMTGRLLPPSPLKEEYSDNLYWSSGSKTDDFISTVSPALELKNNTERLQARLKMQLDGIYYYDNTELNTVDQDYSGSLRYAVTSRAKLSTSAGYRRDSRIDSDFTESGLLLGSNVTRDRYTYSLGGDYALSRSHRACGCNMVLKVINTIVRIIPTIPRIVSICHSTGISPTLLSSTIGRINLGAISYDCDSSQVTSYSGTVGAERSLDERFSYFADIGMSYTQSSFR